MSTSVYYALIILCLGVIGVSVYFIFRQLKLNEQRKLRIEAGESRLKEERAKRIESIQVILQAVEQDDRLTWTEAAIRIKNLLDQLSLDFSEHEAVKAIYVLEEHTQHIPTHEQWSELPLQARRKYKSEMDALETRHVEQLRQAKHYLLAYKFE